MTLIFATNNQHKADEVKAALPATVSVITLKEAGIVIDIPEPHQTLEENAAEKARTIYNLTDTSCFSEDTGLEVEALNGAPGVHSARYAGEDVFDKLRTSEKNIQKLLLNLKDSNNRKARFRTVAFLIINKEEFLFEGICEGQITRESKGEAGFGYDAIFIPDGSAYTFAEMTIEEKNRFSHRRKAMDKLVTFLNDYKAKGQT